MAKSPKTIRKEDQVFQSIADGKWGQFNKEQLVSVFKRHGATVTHHPKKGLYEFELSASGLGHKFAYVKSSKQSSTASISIRDGHAYMQDFAKIKLEEIAQTLDA